MTRQIPVALLFLPLFSLMTTATLHAELQLGAAVVNVTPDQFPILINGNMLPGYAKEINTPVNARALVISDGQEQIAIVVVDSCMIPRELLDEAKKFASDKTGIAHDRILISATHTHTAPSSCNALGTDADPNYAVFLRGKLVDAIAAAQAKRVPAKIGFGKIDANKFTALRRWIRRPDRLAKDPFGNDTLRANMHAAGNLDNVVGESGPEDPDLSLISFQTPDGKPLAVLANFSMHYFGDKAVSADYYGLFSEGLKKKIAGEKKEGDPEFVGIMSHGCSGDIWRRDYTNPTAPENSFTITQFTDGMLALAMQAYGNIKYEADAKIAMAETRLAMKYRVPDQQLLEWAQRIMKEAEGRPLKNVTEVYAREQILLHELQSTEVVVQALRIGSIGIATTPTETYALTGLKLKTQSPLEKTIVIELANGADGYIPPPEQHLLGGYNTWPARTAGLEVNAEPRIAEAALELLEKVAGQPRREMTLSTGPATQAIRDLKPTGYWRLDETAGPIARDSSGHGLDGTYEPQVAFYLEGPRHDAFCLNGEKNRSAHFVDDRLLVRIPELSDAYTVSAWVWNGMPSEGRDVSGWFFSRGPNHGLGHQGDHLGVGGTSVGQGKLIFTSASGKEIAAGKTDLPRWTWQHVVLVRNKDHVRVYLNGNATPEIDIKSAAPKSSPSDLVFIGGRSDNQANWEGRLDEVAFFNRALEVGDIQKLFPAEAK